MLGLPRLACPARDRARVYCQQLSDISLPNVWQAAVQLLQESAAISVYPSNELIKSVADHVPYALYPNQGRLESVEVAGVCVHCRAHIDESRIKRCPLLVAEVGGLELGLQVGESPAHVGEPLVCGAVYLWTSSDLLKGFLKCGLDALDFGIDLDQPTVLRVFGGGCGQAVSSCPLGRTLYGQNSR